MSKKPAAVLPLLPRLGPKVNVRVGGAHKSRRKLSRREVKIALKIQGDLYFLRLPLDASGRGVATETLRISAINAETDKSCCSKIA
jgi:hypothetical protein